MKPPAAFRVGHGVIQFTVYPWKNSRGGSYWRWKDGDGKHHTRKSKKEATTDATEMARNLAKGVTDLNALPDHQKKAIARLLAVGLTAELADEFIAWKKRERPEKDISEAVSEFIAIKEANKDRSSHNVQTLTKHLSPFARHFPRRSISSITVPELNAFLTHRPMAARTRENIRSSLVTFFRWCRASEYLPPGDTAAERTQKPIVVGKVPSTYSPAELKIMLAAVMPEYLPWLAIAAFSGVRVEEMFPTRSSTKSPLDWSDFHWDRKIIIVRPETAKTGRRRVVPILPALEAWLAPFRDAQGPVRGDMPSPNERTYTRQAETVRLGALVGGWKPNALRHSFISYRAAQAGLGQTAMEAGNSESEAKKSYNDAKGGDEADAWFGLRPENSAELSS